MTQKNIIEYYILITKTKLFRLKTIIQFFHKQNHSAWKLYIRISYHRKKLFCLKTIIQISQKQNYFALKIIIQIYKNKTILPKNYYPDLKNKTILPENYISDLPQTKLFCLKTIFQISHKRNYSAWKLYFRSTTNETILPENYISDLPQTKLFYLKTIILISQKQKYCQDLKKRKNNRIIIHVLQK